MCLAEITPAVKKQLPLAHVVHENGNPAKISREQLGAHRPVWETNLVNPTSPHLACMAALMAALVAANSSAGLNWMNSEPALASGTWPGGM